MPGLDGGAMSETYFETWACGRCSFRLAVGFWCRRLASACSHPVGSDVQSHHVI
jgi:hypothetical protein